MSNRILQKPRFNTAKGKNGFDLSHRTIFSSSVGHLIPVMTDILYPGDKISFKYDLFTRTQPLQSAAFTRVVEHIETFFVPFQQLYSLFPQFIYGVGKPNSTLMPNEQADRHLPMISNNLFNTFSNGSWAYKEDVMSEEGKRFPAFAGTLRLFDMFNCGRIFSREDSATLAKTINFTPFFFAAYQKIFYDYYCVDQWEELKPENWNLDTSSLGSNVVNYDDQRDGMFTLRYRPWRKDYFTNIFTSPLISENDINRFGNPDDTDNPIAKVRQYLFDYSTAINATAFPKGIDGLVASQSDKATTVANGYSTVNPPVRLFNTQTVRQMFAVEKLLQCIARNEKTYQGQTFGMFGFDVPDGISEKAYEIGRFNQPIQISEVVGTATTEESYLGEIAGKGYSYGNSNNDTFVAPCHGIFMAVYSAEPLADYYANGMSPINQFCYREDFFLPVLDELGMEPIFETQLDNFRNSSIFGWSYRFLSSKLRYNEIHSSFADAGQQLSSWVTARNTAALSNNSRDFYISPSYLDSIMLDAFSSPFAQYTPAASGYSIRPYDMDQITCLADPLLHSLDISYFKSSQMSTYSLPKLSL